MTRTRDIPPEQLIELLAPLHNLLPEKRCQMVDELVARYGRGNPQVLAPAEIIKKGVSPLTPQIPSSLDMSVEQWTSGVPVTAITGSVQAQVFTAEQVCPNSLEHPPEPVTILVDAELMRILTALGHGVTARMWAAGQQMTRDGDGGGRLDEHEFLDTLIHWGWQSPRGEKPITYKNLRKYLSAGDRVLWDWDEQGSLIYLYAPIRMTRRDLKGRLNAVQMALDAGRSELVETNLPGTKCIAVPFAGTQKEWEGKLLAAWLNSRADHITAISGTTLGVLFGVDRKTILAWRKAANIAAERGVVQYTDNEHIPLEHAIPYLAESETVNGKQRYEVRAYADYSNILKPPTMKERQHKRSPRERFRASKLIYEAAMSSLHPNSDCGAAAEIGSVGFKATGRRNFTTNDGNLKKAFARLRSHLQRHTDDHAPHVVQLGFDQRRQCWIYEQSSTGIQRTKMNDQVPRRLADPIFAANGGRSAIVSAWRGY